MAVKPYTSDPVVLTALPTIQGTDVPALTTRVIKAATATNTGPGPIALLVYLVPSGQVAAAGNTLISARSIASGESYPCPELINQALNAGGTVQALGAGLTFKYTATDFV